jgi:hypothetical protein
MLEQALEVLRGEVQRLREAIERQNELLGGRICRQPPWSAV